MFQQCICNMVQSSVRWLSIILYRVAFSRTTGYQCKNGSNRGIVRGMDLKPPSAGLILRLLPTDSCYTCVRNGTTRRRRFGVGNFEAIRASTIERNTLKYQNVFHTTGKVHIHLQNKTYRRWRGRRGGGHMPPKIQENFFGQMLLWIVVVKRAMVEELSTAKSARAVDNWNGS